MSAPNNSPTRDEEILLAQCGEVVEETDDDCIICKEEPKPAPSAPSREQQLRKELFLLKRELESKKDIIKEKDATIITLNKFLNHVRDENKRLTDDSDPTTSFEELEGYAWKIFKAAEQKVVRDFTLLFELRSKLFPSEVPTQDMGEQVMSKCIFKFHRYLDKKFVVEVPSSDREEGEVFHPAVRSKVAAKRSRTE